jgi:hypothetical protein
VRVAAALSGADDRLLCRPLHAGETDTPLSGASEYDEVFEDLVRANGNYDFGN